jgi:predicted Ser/Thr protein kinase
VGGLARLIGSLLTWLHTLTPNVCPGGWPWAVTLAGTLLAISPVFGAVFVALARKGIGNHYPASVVVTFGLVGLAFGFVLPWVYVTTISGVLSGTFPASTFDPTSLQQNTCFLARFGNQGTYLTGGNTVYEALMQPMQNPILFGIYLATLVGLPALSLLGIVLQQRIALRRGPRWPGRLMWLSFVLFALSTVGVSANLMSHLWLGFLPGTLLGLLVVKLCGEPSWSVINRPPPQDRERAREPERMQPARPRTPQPAPRPVAAAAKPPPQPTRIAAPAMLPDAVPQPPPPAPVSRTALPAVASQLANTPGPLPFGAGAAAGGPMIGGAPRVLWNSANGRFRRVRQLGHGGFGTVWLAVDTQLDRTVALKFAHAPDDDTQQRMMREARALAAVHHPNCVRVYDIIEDVDGLGIVMEYIDGRSLADTVGGAGPVDDVAAARLWFTMAGALGAAHAKGVLHRDVKPANVLLDHEGQPNLIDFGIARSKGDVTLTAVGMMMGTPDFLAPETAASGIATPASDAWQLAATVSYALTGQPPRGHRENPMSALMAAAQRLPNTHLPDRSRHKGLLRAALDPEPSRRPTLTTVQHELEAWVAGTGQTLSGPVTRVISPANRMA